MIKKKQGRGYAKVALYALLSKIEEAYGKQSVYLRVYKKNIVAIQIYQTIGLIFTDQIDEHGKLVMVLDVK